MKKLLTTLFCSLIGVSAFSQWTPTSAPKRGFDSRTSIQQSYYKLDLNKIKMQLEHAQESGANAKPVEISLPTLNGKIERFAVYSFPVVVKELADKYQLGSYAGVGIDDPTKYLRFSVAPNDFQAMIIAGGEYAFIEPANSDKTVYGVHPKSKPTAGKSFVCTTEESPSAVKDIDQLYEKGKSFANQPGDFSKMSDKKYRTMRLAMSVTGEYTQFHGGTVAGALAAINATMTRVNGVFEKDFALHLNLQNFPGIIYVDAATDPYSAATAGAGGAWTLELQNTLTANVGAANYDIGHLFGASGGGGNAGCIGCVCIDPTTSVPAGKGSGYTSPADAIPEGDNFDIDYVAHEMGHQLGGNHTFSHALEGTGVNVEPGSGSTIMGYAGITGANTDVQPHSDDYFHIATIKQVQANLIAKTCDVETVITNNPPVIAALPTYNIPKGTAFVLTASATDAENDPMTYTWEEVDNASVTINKNNLGTTTTGATFRSVLPTTNPTRYFPRLSSVLAGALDNSLNTWESVSMVPRTTKFSVTVRDNNPAVNQQQTQYAEQTIVVGNDGPFKVNTLYAYSNAPTTLAWDVANTTAAPYNVANVKIDYTTDNGTTWVVLSASTPNDGSEAFTFPAALNGQTIKLRISSIGNVFYAVRSILVTPLVACDGTAPSGVAVSNIAPTSAVVNWAPVSGAASYSIRYKKVSETTWTTVTSNTNSVTLSGLVEGTAYEVQVASVCSGTTGTYSASSNFSTTTITYCAAASATGAILYISKVTVANIANISGSSTYTNFTANPTLQVNLVKGSTYSLTINGSVAAYNTAMVFIDYNRDGTFASTERVLNFPVANVASFTGSFTVPATALEGQPLRMRVLFAYAGQANAGLSGPAAWACGTTNFNDGEVEDYNVVVVPTNLGTSESIVKNDGIQLYPNPASDVLNVTKVSDKATYKIYSVAGQLVDSGNINDGKINVSALIKGGYMITIDEKGKDLFKSKFIKK